MEEIKPLGRFEIRDKATEKSFQDLELALGKLKTNLEKIRTEEEKTKDSKQANITTEFALDILREDVRKLLKELANNI